MDINFLILACALVTFIPRLIPAIFVGKLNFSPKFEKFLNLIPYTALAALICPGVLTVDNKLWYIGLIGAIVAGALAWKKVPLGAIVIFTVVILIAVYSIVPFFSFI
ncbi:AzlD domain-containing protein [uncultured Methanobrevibacter sp.]|uniref:AzlD domain-containing protein n=1 Tax=uncultured Methanobrevibacter sp. TaxID=253161 RepID=UPI002632A778